jgi:hypothetical protein
MVIKLLRQTIIILALYFSASSVEANDKHNVFKVKKTSETHRMSWKRTKAFNNDGNDQICVDFEKVLNTTRESPDQFKCNWILPPGEKRFKKFAWQPIGWKSYWGLIKDLRTSGLRRDLRENVWEKDQERIRKLFENRQRSLAIAAIDIDNDGYAEQVVRDDNIPCKEDPGVTFGVIDPKSNRLDWRFRYLFLDVNGNEGAEIMLYKSKAYMFGWVYGIGIVMIWEGSPGTDSRGRANICQFKYYKGGIKQ